jgi:hypothetical protein
MGAAIAGAPNVQQITDAMQAQLSDTFDGRLAIALQHP